MRRMRLALPPLALLLFAGLFLSACNAPVRVTWKTETEMNTAGFNLYRGASPDGPFDTKVNETLIPPSSDPLTGKEYTYVDTTAQVGVTYYYQLQEVEHDGTINTFGPITVRTGGLTGQHVALVGGLAVLVLILWVAGGRVRQNARRANG